MLYIIHIGRWRRWKMEMEMETEIYRKIEIDGFDNLAL